MNCFINTQKKLKMNQKKLDQILLTVMYKSVTIDQ